MTLATEVKKHDQILQNNSELRDVLAQHISDNNKLIEKSLAQQENLSNRIDGIVWTRNESSIDLQSALDELKGTVSKPKAEITVLKNQQTLQAKAINSQLFKSADQPVATSPPPALPIHSDPVCAAPNSRPLPFQTVLNIVVKGLSKEPVENLSSKLILLCGSIGVCLSTDDITNAFRIRRCNPIKGRPNPDKLTLRDLATKEKIMRNKGTFSSREDLKSIWINHDKTTIIRRAKVRARRIASFARNKGTSVQITKRGITLDHVFYPYNRLDSIPSIYIPPRTLSIPSTINNHNSQTNRIPADTNQNLASMNDRSTNPLR